VFSLFSEGKISSGKAGKLLGISRLEFIKLLKTRGISFVNYTEDEIKEELEAVTKMIVVSDTTPLIGLSSIGRLELLRELFDDVYIPQAVFDETVTSGREEGKAKQAVAKANWIHVVEVKDRLPVNILLDEMDLGEIETIVLASELNADWVLMDEKKGRRKLSQLNIPKIGTVGILLKAKQLGLVSNLKSELGSLQKSGFSRSNWSMKKS